MGCRPVPDPPCTHSRPVSLFGFKIVTGTRGKSWILELERWLSRLVPSTHFRWLTTGCNFSASRSNSLFLVTAGTCTNMVHIKSYRHTCTHFKKTSII